MTQGHRGQGLTQDAQVVLRQAYSLLNRTNQIGRKQVAGAMHMPSPLPAVDIWHLWTPQFMCSYWAMFSFCTHPAMLMTERGENLTTIQNLSRKSQGITKTLALWVECPGPQSAARAPGVAGMPVVHCCSILITSKAWLHTRTSFLWDRLSICACDFLTLLFSITCS